MQYLNMSETRNDRGSLRHNPSQGVIRHGSVAEGMGEIDLYKRIGFLVKKNEPGAFDHIIRTYGYFDYRTINVLVHAVEDLGLRAQVVRAWVQGEINDGDRSRAVRALSESNAASLSIFDGERIADEQYRACLEEGNPSDAWRIASTMLLHGDRIVKVRKGEAPYKPSQEWVKREEESFIGYAEGILKENENAKERIDDSMLFLAFNHLEFKDYGFKNGTPSPLALRIAMRCIRREIDHGNYGFAMDFARRAKMDESFIQSVEDELYKTPKIVKALRNRGR